MELGTGLRIIGSRFSPDTARSRDLAARNRILFRFIDLDDDEAAEALLDRFGIEPLIVHNVHAFTWSGWKVPRTCCDQ
jgi:thioredoxin reductase (NADPH)